jgi:hypothetical protein
MGVELVVEAGVGLKKRKRISIRVERRSKEGQARGIHKVKIREERRASLAKMPDRNK